MMYKNISLILPVRDEKGNIEILLDKTLEYLGRQIEIIVVDDWSRDGTDRIVEKLSSQHANIRLIRNRKKGLASAIYSGVESAKNEVVCWMDADLSMPVEIIPILLSELNNCDIVIGSRYVKGGLDLRNSKLRVNSSKFFNLMSRKMLHTSTFDLTSGFVITRKEVVNKIGFRGKQGEYCIWFLFQAERLGLRIKESPYSFIERKTDRSKIGPNAVALLINFRYYLCMVARCKVQDLLSCRKNILPQDLIPEE